MLVKDLISIVLIAVTMFLGMLFGLLGMCGVNVHIYSIIATVTITLDTAWIYVMISKYEHKKNQDNENL